MATQTPVDNTQEWNVKGSDCCSPASTCLLAWCLPCILYGRTHHRLRKDPGLKDWNFCNADCCGWYALACCGCQWIVQMMQRGDIRKKHNLKGDGCQDCLCACCCTPCDLMQMDKEVELRDQKAGLLVTAQPNTGNEKMQYQPGVQQHQLQQQPVGVDHKDGQQVQSPVQPPVYHQQPQSITHAVATPPSIEHHQQPQQSVFGQQPHQPAFGQQQQPMQYQGAQPGQPPHY